MHHEALRLHREHQERKNERLESKILLTSNKLIYVQPNTWLKNQGDLHTSLTGT